MTSCPDCGKNIYVNHWKTISTERSGAYTVYSYVTTKCAEDCGYVETRARDQERFEMA